MLTTETKLMARIFAVVSIVSTLVEKARQSDPNIKAKIMAELDTALVNYVPTPASFQRPMSMCSSSKCGASPPSYSNRTKGD